MREVNGSQHNSSPIAFNPLLDFYAAAQRTPPVFEELPGELVPEPARSLLVHNGDMTPALEAFHKTTIYLQVLESHREPVYRRQVVLRLDGSGKAVEFGAIVIHLENFEPAPQVEILQGTRPLGTILHEHAVLHLSQPRSFFFVQSDKFIESALDLKQTCKLYGRANRLVTPNGAPLAEIVEILPPA